jgi:hypothetical protein
MAQVQDQRVARLALIRKRHDDLVDRQLPVSQWSEVQRDRSELLDQIDLLTAQLTVARIDLQILKGENPIMRAWRRRPGPVAEWDCDCGHSAEAHEHYRRGTDCARCGCTEFEPVPADGSVNAR